jgi:hypothetical protein
MWPGWSKLQRAAATADLPMETLPGCLSGIEMLFAADLQWDRFLAAARIGLEQWGSAPVFTQWLIEAHFFLVAADNAGDRLIAWARAVGDAELIGIVDRLRIEGVKEFRHHQEHLEERMPGGRHESKAQLSAPGNDMIRIEGGGSVFAMNNLIDNRLTFGDGEVDLAATHSTIIEVASDLLRALEARSRFLRHDAPPSEV